MRNKLFFLIPMCVAALAFAPFGDGTEMAQTTAHVPDPDAAEMTVKLSADAMPLYTKRPDTKAAGDLSYIAGWELTGNNWNFGGFSGLLVSNDEKKLIALSDKGYWLTASLNITSYVQPLYAGVIRHAGTANKENKETFYDAESLTEYNGGFLIGAENNNRLLFTPSVSEPLVLSPLNDLVDLSGLSNNNGIEAMTTTPQGEIWMFAENSRNAQGNQPAWKIVNGKADKLLFHAPKNFSPTDAAALADGSLLILMRKYSALEGVAMKLLHIPRANLEKPILEGIELAHLTGSEANIDNMEGLDIVLRPDGSYHIYMMSDDNFNIFQRTILLLFSWQPPQLSQ
ncbi:esterase-like activity of phytase family protein [Kordiimonas pumila]|uniref:Esterase-like activity of phytase family protein n=1 Tax=Kordiimonas pumila TaxID=2161677 RepID=A0ABV7D337_9PROT|nr:esterase-like activity of phytase family protein [Kordiimonas pumila]